MTNRKTYPKIRPEIQNFFFCIRLLPIALETLGRSHKVAVEQVKRIGAAVARHQGSDERVATRQLFQRLSLTLMRGNAALILGRKPDSDFAAPEVDGVL